MKPQKKRSLRALALRALLVALALLAAATTCYAAASGNCGRYGDNVTWTLSDDGVLTISGTGEMEDYAWGEAPWYSQRDSVKLLRINRGVTHIGNYAFYDCGGFAGSLSIPASVTSIGDGAFVGCSGFTGSLSIPDSVTSIGEDAFSDCGGFSGSLSIGNSVTTIGDEAFSGCDGFTGSLSIGNSVTTIGDAAFSGCSGFTGSLTIPGSVTTIGDEAFSGCDGFTGSLSIPDSVTTIGVGAFGYCSGFNGSLMIPDSVATIGNGAFSYCSGFNGSLSIPGSVTTIGEGAFSGCSGFNGSLSISNSVTTIGFEAFWGCSGFTGSLSIPDSVSTIGGWSFTGCRGFTGPLSIGSSVATIGQAAFSGCSGFTGSLTIPDSVTTIDSSAFQGCGGFSGSLSIPDSVTTIGPWAFEGCSGFTGSLSIPDSVTGIDYQTFANCSGFSDSLSIPDSVTSIGEEAFSGCASLTEVTISSSVTDFGRRAFNNCPNLTINCYEGSAAHTYAINNGIAFHLLAMSPQPSIALQTKSGGEITSFAYEFGSFIPSVGDTRHYDSSVNLSIYSGALSGDAQEVTIQLPEGFSFSYNELQPTLTVSLSSFTTSKVPVYPLYREANPGLISVEASGALALKREYPVFGADTATVYAEQEAHDLRAEILPSKRIWRNMGASFNENLAWVCDLLTFPYKGGSRDESIESLQNLGFVDIAHEPLDESDEAGLECYFGTRSVIENGEIRHVVCMINIGQYKSAQWIGNFTVFGIHANWGMEYDETHYNFQQMANQLEAKLGSYCEKYDIRPERSGLLVTGHSRAGAASAIIVHDRNQGKAGAIGRFDDAAAYTFASPNTTKSPTNEKNIHNFIYFHDVVPYVPNWSGYGKYGQTYVFGEDNPYPRNDLIQTLLWVPVELPLSLYDVTIYGRNKIINGLCDLIQDQLTDSALSEKGMTKKNVLSCLSIGKAHMYPIYLRKDLLTPSGKITYAQAAWQQRQRAFASLSFPPSRMMDLIHDPVQDATKEAIAVLWKSVADMLSEAARSFSVLRIGCPVDASFNASDGTVIAKFENHELIEFNEEYGMAWSGKESSNLLIDEDVDYKVTITGNDVGEMNINAVTINSKDEVVGVFERKDVPVYTGEAYSLLAIGTETSENMKLDSLAEVQKEGEAGGFAWRLYDSGRLSITGTGPMLSAPQGFAASDVRMIEIGDGVTGVCARAFPGCSAVTCAILPSSLKAIGEDAFAACARLKDVHYGASVFACANIEIEGGNKPLSDAAWHYENQNVLNDLEGYDTLALPEGMTEIGEEAFQGIAAQVVVLPEDCELVKTGAFADCENLLFIVAPEGVAFEDGAYDSAQVEVIER